MPRRSLARAEVVEIKRLLVEGTQSQRQIARIFGTTQPTISRILSGEMWADVPWPGGSPPAPTLTKMQGVRELEDYSRKDALTVEATARLHAALSSDDDEDDFENMFKKGAKT